MQCLSHMKTAERSGSDSIFTPKLAVIISFIIFTYSSGSTNDHKYQKFILLISNIPFNCKTRGVTLYRYYYIVQIFKMYRFYTRHKLQFAFNHIYRFKLYPINNENKTVRSQLSACRQRTRNTKLKHLKAA